MQKQVDFSGQPFHFIGIGGIGMSALAHILLKHRLPVSGSDVRLNPITEKLQSLGATIFDRQEAANLQHFVAATGQPQQLPQVVCSTAIREDNPEYQAALSLGCPILHRSDLLAALITQYEGIAVAGTHGKTTTSSLIGYLLLQAGQDPTIVVGGEVKAWQGNARLGESNYLVAEADESDGSLVKFAAKIGIITNIELDHPDHYSSIDQVVEIFRTFAERTETLIVSWDCPTIRERLADHPNLVRYSLSPKSGADYTVSQVVYSGQGTTAQVWERGTCLGALNLPLLGEHNLKNALATIAVGRLVNLSFADIADALISFEGAKRRFEVRGEAQGIRFIDDYAHHPSEIQVTLAAARLQVEDPSTPWKRVVAVFQPHRYSRTYTFLDEFSRSFSNADLVFLTSIYSAGEPDQGLVKGEHLAARMTEYHQHVNFESTLVEIKAHLPGHLRSGDLVLFLGAGNLNQLIPEMITAVEATHPSPSRKGTVASTGKSPEKQNPPAAAPELGTALSLGLGVI
jgi:UDP-N-acetylmuramate--alanine ligase